MKKGEKIAIVTSFAVTCVLGTTLLTWYWLHYGPTVLARYDNGPAVLAAKRAALFVASMAIVHAWGICLYESQPWRTASLRSSTTPVARHDQDQRLRGFCASLPPAYRRAVKSAMIQQIVCGLLSSLVLDFGQVFGLCFVVVIAHWFVFTLIVSRRRFSPTKLDLAIIHYGFVPVFALAVYVAQILHELTEL